VPRLQPLILDKDKLEEFASIFHPEARAESRWEIKKLFCSTLGDENMKC
jgi:hypothetical protein